MLSSAKFLNKIENLQKRALGFMLSDYERCSDEVLRLSGSCAINVRLKKGLCVEIYKSLNDLNPSFMWEIFETHKFKKAVKGIRYKVREKYKINSEMPRVNQTSFGTKSLRFYGPILWSHITLNRPKICYVLKTSSETGMVHFVVIKSAGSSTL